ncbi:hypothetical protein Pnap_0677 [Polaromonas naphthalenivorans CJ2]|uniref:Uncharacterized protein n=2 Tax=Polaromonas naphthalenivorans TaxID=216465 RepID=A1VK18_POLNA|nr:hypothetical protein Pnap_0677 [Polaromonas naphthalenivorans CJ2]
MSLSLVDATGNEVTNRLLSQTQAQFLKVVVKKSTGAAAPYTRVALTLDSTQAVLVPNVSSQLTDVAGILLVRIAPADVSSSGAVQVTAATTVDAVSLTQNYDLQITPGTVSLSGLAVSSTTVQKGQSINVVVDVKVNGVAAASNSVAVTFASGCGAVSPASALVDAAGQAKAVVQTNSTGACVVSASSSGVSVVTGYTVTAPPIAGLQFVSAIPSLIYQTGSVGANTSVVNFKVIDSVGAAVTTGVKVNASLTNTDGGINFCGSPSSITSGSDGVASFSICAGTLPTTVQVTATLDPPNAAISTSSNLLTVQTGLPTQRFFDIAATQLNFYAGGYFTGKFNGNSVDITVNAADRQGNPVPDGTKIVFVSEGGQINSAGQSSCLIASGFCTVRLIGQDYRPMGSNAANGDPRPGRVTVLAYADGEEYFIDTKDANGIYNNRYDIGELFEDLGSPYIDKDESGAFVSSYKNLVTNTDDGETFYPMPAGSTGSTACPVNSNRGLSVAATCNSKWDGYTKVRRSIVIVFSGGEIGQPGFYDSTIPAKYHTQVISKSKGGITVQLSDYDGNPLPADATLAVEVIPSGGTCTATLFGTQIGSSTEPTAHSVGLDKCLGGEVVRFKASVTAGSSTKVTAFDVTVP